MLDELATRLRQPAPAIERTLVAAKCEAEDPAADCPRPRSCTCTFTTTNSLGEKYAEAVALGLSGGCDYNSRSGPCLIEASEFAGCEPGNECSCAPACERALAAIAADEARVFDVEERYATCVNTCRMIVRIEDSCYIAPSGLAGPSYDCTLSNEEILRLAFPPPSDAGTADCTNGCTLEASSSGCGWAVGACTNCWGDAGPLDCPAPDGG